MIYPDNEARSLFARERAELLASEMRAARPSASVEASRSRPSRLGMHLARLGQQRREKQPEAPAYEMSYDVQ
jgi:hypothetical protein